MYKNLSKLWINPLKLKRMTKSVVRFESSTELVPAHKVTPKRKRKPTDAPIDSADIIKYYGNQGKAELINRFPVQFIKKKSSCDYVYVANDETADVISDFVSKDGRNCPIFEMNPGLGMLTVPLLKKTESTIHCFESTKDFKKDMHNILTDNVDRLSYVDGDFLRLSVRDSIDHKGRIQPYFPDKKEWTDGC